MQAWNKFNLVIKRIYFLFYFIASQSVWCFFFRWEGAVLRVNAIHFEYEAKLILLKT